jgi:anaphase-promoting complex subunit 1
MQITTKLLKVVHNNDFATAVHGCTIALGLIYLKTNQVAVAEKLFVPQTMHQLDRIPPDLIVLRTISRNLIMWDEIDPSKEWIQRNLPPFLRALENERAFREDMITIRQAYEAIVAGCCYSIALRFAGTFNKQAFETILYYYKLFEEFSITGRLYIK